ncbi:T9SS type A sorting domain-containing protein [Aureitalea sp. L0-47]|uniref:T9SS type A sorting domain-containing protein n=1 Tax=Aureitalea sp. L0-47 TaxID=2816962 RepID=UPI002238DB5D|nr:T9SS type A sorting domain-containing protein [Aureitalea sp. L0-47]MCW5520622.1 T9SS type A sorting domain-containing protein [Aureitalea sp. L0-47]
MKRSIFIILFSLSQLVCAQSYTPLLDNYNEWKFTTCFFGCLTDLYYTDGDTVVNNTEYKILDGYHYISRTFLLREDLQDKKIYLRILNYSNEEFLLYDFSMDVGDSIDMKNPITPFVEDAGYYRLDSIVPRPLFDGNDYNHFYLSPTPSNTVSTNNAVWVEGAGSLSTITAPSGLPDINEVGHLSCFFKNGELFYSNLDSIDVCEPSIILEIDEFRDDLSEVQVINSDSHDYCHIINTENVMFIDIYGLTGKRVNSVTNSGNSMVRLEFTNFQAGIYLVTVTDRLFKKKTFKVIVQ